VISTDWYADYIATAHKKGLLDGDNGNANPNDSLTREEMAKILVSAYEMKNDKINDTAQVLQDEAEVSDWAKLYVNKAMSAGIMNGVSDHLFAPKASALREQTIVAIYRIINN
ncbi:MAG: S-layer homology domain-containing protein, partial [Oscillospiraceae bacterium]